MSPDSLDGRGGRPGGRWRWSLLAGGVLVLLGLALVLPQGGETPLRPTSLGTVVGSAPRAQAASPVPVIRAQPLPRVAEPVPPAATGEALSAALSEERVVLASSAVIEGIDADRPWVCAGEAMSLSARVGGELEPDAVYRWVWPGSETGAELHPGPRLQWRAPATAGRYFVRFQVCRDLGGRRVGVLAERAAPIDVRACSDGQARDAGALRIGVTQEGRATFRFQALAPDSERLTGYAWDFGDGAKATTAGPEVQHAYAVQGLGAQDVRSFTVRLTASRAGGGPRVATAFALVRGQPGPDSPPAAELDIQRWAQAPGREGWRSALSVRVPEGSDVTWERVERLIVSGDDQVASTTRAWRDAITVEEDLGRGGFRGFVTVSPAEAAPGVKQVLDSLHGRDASGREVALSWAAYKREASPEAPGAPQRSPPK